MAKEAGILGYDVFQRKLMIIYPYFRTPRHLKRGDRIEVRPNRSAPWVETRVEMFEDEWGLEDLFQPGCIPPNLEVRLLV